MSRDRPCLCFEIASVPPLSKFNQVLLRLKSLQELAINPILSTTLLAGPNRTVKVHDESVDSVHFFRSQPGFVLCGMHFHGHPRFRRRSLRRAVGYKGQIGIELEVVRGSLWPE